VPKWIDQSGCRQEYASGNRDHHRRLWRQSLGAGPSTGRDSLRRRGPRGEQRYDDVSRTDLSLLWGLPLRITGRAEIFFRGVVYNVFNQAAQTSANETILTRTNDARFALFNPFTTAPVQGTHWDYRPEYGRPTGTGDYQAPREFSFSVGVRF